MSGPGIVPPIQQQPLDHNRLELYKTLQDHTDEITACVFSRSHFVTLSLDTSLNIYDYPSLEKTGTIPLGRDSFPRALAASPDGKYFGVALEKHVLILEGPDFKTRAQLPLQETFHPPSVDFSSDGSRVAVASGHHLALYTLPDLELERSIDSEAGVFNHARFSPDSTRLLVAVTKGSPYGLYRMSVVAGLYQVPGLEAIKQREEQAKAETGPCCWSPDGKYGVVATDRRFFVEAECRLAPYAFVNGLPIMSPLKQIKAHVKEIFDVEFSPDGKYLASVSGKNVILHEMPEFEKVAQLQSDYNPAFFGSCGKFTSLAWSPDSKHLAVTTEGKFEYRSTRFNEGYNERIAGGAALIFDVK